MGRSNDKHEQEADRVAETVVGSSRGGASQGSAQSTVTTTPTQGAPAISRLADSSIQNKLQRREAEEKEEIKPEKVQRQEEEEEEVQPKLQRQEEEPQAKIQRQEEEEEEVQPQLQRQEEEPQAKIQRQEEEEEEAQTKLQRQEEEPQAKIQRQEEEEEEAQTKLQRQEEEEAQTKLQRQAEEEPQAKKEEDESSAMQTKTEARANVRDKRQFPELNQVEQKLFDNKGKGEKLDDETRVSMETGFSTDFSGVRIHQGADSVAMNRDLKAQAFTHGKDVFFNSGKYEPESIRGKTLLAHELTHVVQQGAAEQKLPETEVKKNNAKRNNPVPEPTDKNTRALEQQNAEKIKASEPKLGEKPEAQSGLEVAGGAAETAGKPVVEAGSDAGAESAGQEQQAEQQKSDESSEASGEGNKKAAVKGKAKAGKAKGKGAAKGAGVGAFLRKVTKTAFDSKKAAVSKLAANEKKTEDAETKLAKTEKAVVPPAQEGQSRSNASQVETVENTEEPKPDETKAKQDFNTALEQAIPTSLEAVDKFKEQGKGRAVGEAVKGVVSSDTQQVKATYQEIENTPEPQPPEQEPEPLPEIEQAPETGALNMGEGMVGEIQAEHTDLSNFENESDDMLREEQISDEQLEMVDEGDLAEANKERKQVKENAKKGPKEAKQLEQDKKQQVAQDLNKEELQGKQKMKEERQKELNGAQQDQKKTKSKIELKRQAVTDHINTIYETANTAVKQKLDDLEKQSLANFDKGEKAATKSFEDNVKRRMDAFKRRRYDRIGGSLLWAKDKLFGMDELPEVKNIFDSEKSRFIKSIDKLVATITAENKKVIQQCKELVENARKKIETFVSKLGPELQQTGQAALTEMKGKLDALNNKINEKEKELKKKLEAKRDAAIKAIEEKIEKMKEEMSGLISKLGNLLLNAMLKFFEWALKKAGYATDQLMSIINKGKVIIKKIVTDPIAFIGNIISAVKKGIGQFVTNIKKHLISGLISWLTGAMADVPITLPTTWNLKGILSLILQILGLTWDRIRVKLVKRVGEKVVKVAETGVTIVKKLVTEGPMALWEMIKEKAAEIKQQVMDGIRNWLITQVVKQAIIKLLSFLNPAGAIVQAILAIYNTIMFFVENWQRIVDFVGSVFNSIGDIAAGKISAAAAKVEQAMAMTIPIILNFLARLLGLSGLGKAVSNIIKKIRKPIDKIVNKVIDKIVGFAKKLFKKGKAAAKGAAQKVINIVMPKHSFTAGDESHTISVKKSAGKKVLYIASTPSPIESFLTGYEKKNKATLTDKKKADIKAAKAYIKSDIKPLLTALGKLEETTANKKKIVDLNKQILQKEVVLSGKVKSILGDTGKLKDAIEKYKLEGLTGTYGSMPKPRYDDLTADHQPQAAILQAAAKLPYFKTGSKGQKMRDRAASRANAGYAINLQSKRHMEGRTHGNKGKSTKNTFLDKVKTQTSSLTKVQDKRNVVVNLIKQDLSADVVAMRGVVTKKENWKDLAKFSLKKKEEDKLRNDTKAQILSGENRVASQDLESLKG
ncbi:MAG: DUF4157 domain-containing protein [Gammaproteobacteria bacterium]|nr:DUF4157 domain-containing protein [Gammaproteobacteria bacterium]